MENPKKIPLGDSDFATIISDKSIFIDKSMLINEIIKDDSRVILLTRPRRWGKTTNLSMLQYFFADEVDRQKTQDLFNNLKIAKIENGKILKEHQGKNPVIFITFKDVKELSFEESINKFKVLIQELYRQHDTLLNSDKLSSSDKKNFEKYIDGDINNAELSNALKFLNILLYKSYSQKVVILIDEYDTPLNSAYHNNYLDKLTDFMRNLLSAVLKDNKYLHKGVLTGILKVSKNNMLSGLNNLSSYSILDKEYCDCFGFTEDEVKALFKQQGLNDNLHQVQDWYNGYKIGDTVLYNPWSILSCLHKKGEFAPYWVFTDDDRIIKEALLYADQAAKEKFEALIKGETITGTVSVNITYGDLIKSEKSLWTLLLFGGYLKAEKVTLKEDVYECQLKIPNNEVSRLYAGVFKEWLEKELGLRYQSFLDNLLKDDVEGFTKDLSDYLLYTMSTYDFTRESEYHTFVLGLLSSLKDTHYIQSNKEYGLGRPDCLILPKDKNTQTGIILEFKHRHIKDHEDIETLKLNIKGDAETAIEQIESRSYESAFAKHPHITHLLKVGIAFSSRCVVSAWDKVEINHKPETEKKLTLQYSEIILSQEEQASQVSSKRESKSHSRESTSYDQDEDLSDEKKLLPNTRRKKNVIYSDESPKGSQTSDKNYNSNSNTIGTKRKHSELSEEEEVEYISKKLRTEEKAQNTVTKNASALNKLGLLSNKKLADKEEKGGKLLDKSKTRPKFNNS